MHKINFFFPNIMNDIWMFCHAQGNKYWPKVPDKLWLLRLTVTNEIKWVDTK